MKGNAIWVSAKYAVVARIMVWTFRDIRASHFLLLMCLLTLCTSACVSTRAEDPPLPLATSAPRASVDPTQTPFQPVSATETPDILRVWLSPALPEALKTPLEALSQRGLLELTEDPADASVRVEPHGALKVSEWVYVLAAPFPTVRDGLDSPELRQIWDGRGKVYVSPETLPAIEVLLGPASLSVIAGNEQESLLDIVWEDSSSYAIVPFEALEPRWKVLAVDGMSPIHKSFEPERYALTLPFGLNGDSAAVERLRRFLDWPESNRDERRLTVVVMTGTTALTRTVSSKMDSYGMSYPGEKVGAWLRDADITHISHEVAFSETCPTPDPFQADLRFCASPRHQELLGFVGVDVIELTGNHILDWGSDAFLSTLQGYRELGWGTYGGGMDLDDAQSPYHIEHNGNSLAFLGCNSAGPSRAWATSTMPGAAPCDLEKVSDEIGRLQGQGVIPIFTFQWAEGGVVMPSQKAAFRKVVDAGAVIVSGSQAHQPLGFEFYRGGFIHYGLGNLFFDQMQTIANRQEFIDRHVFYDGRHISTELLTAILEDFAQPRPMTTVERRELLKGIFQDSGW